MVTKNTLNSKIEVFVRLRCSITKSSMFTSILLSSGMEDLVSTEYKADEKLKEAVINCNINIETYEKIHKNFFLGIILTTVMSL